MCNIAGYIGNRDAAPILCEMMKKQAGFAGGYYSGLATISDGILCSAKTLGDMDILVNELHGDKLPGQIGLIHSRSKSGGDGKWAHPFVSNDGTTAYIANGSSGKYNNPEKRDKMTQMLEKKGYRFETATDKSLRNYPHLSDGRSVHISETMCHLVRDIMLTENVRLDEAMERAFLRLPSEVVGLSICTEEPDSIAFGRFNYPCMVARTEDEVFLASTAMAFPKDRNYISITSLPEGSAGRITLKETVIRRFHPPLPIEPITPTIWAEVRHTVEEVLHNNSEPIPFREIAKTAKTAWHTDNMVQNLTVLYEVLREMIKNKQAKIIEVEEPGADEGLDRNIRTTQFFVSKQVKK